ncbi:MAG: amino acid decarboxylase [Candidatus Eremiobacteraeota bacterium]|nr:amino acid decarboxylase [Candidatus Eremiobacteraeota bacterium]
MADFRKDAAEVVRWIDRYLSHARDYPVLSRIAPGAVAHALPEEAPEQGEPFERIMADFERIVIPGITHWNHPRFFAYFSISAAPVAVLAEALAAALDVNAMLWRTSPAATELEDVVLGWLARMMELPPEFHGIVYDTASIGGFTALAGAREALDLDVRDRGMAGRDLPALRVYQTAHTHSHIEKGAIALGIGRANVVNVGTDDAHRMRPDLLERHLRDDVERGFRPMCVVATVGTTSTTSIDPVRAIGEIARRFGIWLHVDAAYAGIAAVLPECRPILDGIELADSLVVNPHKWLFVPIDFSALYIRDPEILRRAFSLVADYLATPEEGVRNYMDYGLQLGRRFRALKLWFVMRSFGTQKIREILRGQIALAAEFAGWVAAEAGWEVMAPHPFSVVCFRYRPRDASEKEIEAANERIMTAVNAGGTIYLSSTRLEGALVLRLAIGNEKTTRDDVRLAWDVLREAAANA